MMYGIKLLYHKVNGRGFNQYDRAGFWGIKSNGRCVIGMLGEE